MVLLQMAAEPPVMDALEILQPLVDVVSPLLVKLSVFVGGLFGLYLILILIRVYYERKKVKLLHDIKYDLDRLNMHYNIGFSSQQKGIFKRIILSIRKKLERNPTNFTLKTKHKK